MSSTHTNPSSDDGLDFVDISIEQFREYELAGGETYRIENPVALFVREDSGNHRVLSRREDGQYVSHHVPGDGQRPIRWVVEPGEPFFLGWSQSAADSTEAPAVQPDPDGSGIGTTSSTGIQIDGNINKADTVETDASNSPWTFTNAYSEKEVELQIRGKTTGESDQCSKVDFADELEDRLHDLGGSATIQTTAQGFSIEENG